MSPRITPEVAARIEEFLVPSRIAVVATVGRGGMPHLTPNWYRYADGAITISTTKERVKYRNLIRDDKLAVCIYSDALASEYLTLTGAGVRKRRRVHMAGDAGHCGTLRGAGGGGRLGAWATEAGPSTHQDGAGAGDFQGLGEGPPS